MFKAGDRVYRGHLLKAGSPDRSSYGTVINVEETAKHMTVRQWVIVRFDGEPFPRLYDAADLRPVEGT